MDRPLRPFAHDLESQATRWRIVDGEAASVVLDTQLEGIGLVDSAVPQSDDRPLGSRVLGHVVEGLLGDDRASIDLGRR